MNNTLGTQRWINQGGILFPFEGDIIVQSAPGQGVWQVTQSPNPSDSRLGLVKVCDSFEFPYKLYKTGGEEISERVRQIWNSEIYKNSKKNLGIIFNGAKGTGKTVSAKLLCNSIKIPTIIVNNSFNGGILEFIQSLQFECCILIDEAEKSFIGDADSQVLLKLIDGVYNSSRKLYILTTNTLNINDNLIGRPGRIRYIKEFGNLPLKSVEEFISDNLINKSKTNELVKEIDRLDISTIDVIKSLVEEMNIMGEIDLSMNIPRAANEFYVVPFYGMDINDESKSQILSKINEFNNENKLSLVDLFGVRDVTEQGCLPKFLMDEVPGLNYCGLETLTTQFPVLWKDTKTNLGTVVSELDNYGFFSVRRGYDGEITLYKLLQKREGGSVYEHSLLK